MVARPCAVQASCVPYPPVAAPWWGLQKRGLPPVRGQRQGLVRVKAVRAGQHVQPGIEHIRQVVHAPTVREGCRVQHGVTALDRLHRGQISQGTTAQLPGAQHHAFGPTGGAAGVKQPCRIVVFALLQRQLWAIGVKYESMVGLQLRGCIQFAQGQLHTGRTLVIYQGQTGLAVSGDPGRFAFVQLGIHRHGNTTTPPDAPHQRQIGRGVVHEQHHPGLPAASPGCVTSGPCAKHDGQIRHSRTTNRCRVRWPLAAGSVRRCASARRRCSCGFKLSGKPPL